MQQQFVIRHAHAKRSFFDCSIDTDLEILIPDSYVENIAERLSLYTRLDNCDTEEDLKEFHQELTDRFGPVTEEVEDLFDTVRIRKLAVKLGFEKISFKNNTVRLYFMDRPDSKYFESDIFRGLLDFIQKQTRQAATLIERAMSSASATTRADFTPAAGTSS